MSIAGSGLDTFVQQALDDGVLDHEDMHVLRHRISKARNTGGIRKALAALLTAASQRMADRINQRFQLNESREVSDRAF